MSNDRRGSFHAGWYRGAARRPALDVTQFRASQVAEVGSYADAVIVGSAFVTALGERGEQGVRDLTAHLASGLPQ